MPRSGVPPLPPFTRTISFGAVVRQVWGDDWLKKDVAYEFSNGRKFAAPEPEGSFYAVSVSSATIWDNGLTVWDDGLTDWDTIPNIAGTQWDNGGTTWDDTLTRWDL